MADTLKDIPEFFETELGESIIARTDAIGIYAYRLASGTELKYYFLKRNISRIRASRSMPYY
jgi:hypothetical protein